jgi:hypothetical protein
MDAPVSLDLCSIDRGNGGHVLIMVGGRDRKR